MQGAPAARRLTSAANDPRSGKAIVEELPLGIDERPGKRSRCGNEAPRPSERIACQGCGGADPGCGIADGRPTESERPAVRADEAQAPRLHGERASATSPESDAVGSGDHDF